MSKFYIEFSFGPYPSALPPLHMKYTSKSTVSGTHYTERWVGPRDGLDRFGKPRPHLGSIPGPSSLQTVAIQTTLSRHTMPNTEFLKIYNNQLKLSVL